LWHGASWNFVLWGGYQGLMLVVHRAFSPLMEKIPKSKSLDLFLTPLFIFVFFQFVCFGWLIFRADSAQQIVAMSSAVLSGVDASEFVSRLPKLIFYIFPLVVVQLFQHGSGNLNYFYNAHPLVKTVFYVGLFYGIFSFGDFGSSEFIYFQF
jgi:alginate O-acetyltransferase complex protein AlgI